MSMNRKEFLTNTTKFCAGSCICALMGSLNLVNAQDSTTPETPKPEKSRAEVRMEFAEKWVKRFFDILDNTLDEETRKKIMLACGKACFLNWMQETGQVIKPVSFERYKQWVSEKVKDGSVRVVGNIIYYQYMNAAETGLPSEEGACLCTFVETKPAGLSKTYCLCSVGYVKEWHEQLLARPVEVELLDSPIMGGKRCKFKITVS